jgi:predicted flap endonuclease-1-like 5' DNA nuclease
MPPITTLIIALIALLVGFLLGWLVEWRIDLAYWRSYFKTAEEAEAAERVIELEAHSAPAPELPPAGQELLLNTLREQAAQRDADLATLRGTIEQLGASEGRWRAREAELLEAARRLQADVEALTEAKADAEAEWRHELARREGQWQESKEADLAGLREESERLRAEAVEARLRAEKEAAARLAQLEQGWQMRYDTDAAALRAENDRLKTRLVELERRFAHYKLNHPATLAEIAGIGPKVEEALRRAGIHTYADLAARTPDELQSLLDPPKWRRLDFEGWIAQARRLAQEEV